MTTASQACRICLQPFQEIYLGDKEGYRFIACRDCGSISADPWAARAEIDQLLAEIEPSVVHLPRPERHIQVARTIIAGLAAQVRGKRFLDVCSRHGYAVTAARQAGLQARGIDPYEFFISFARDKYDQRLFEKATVQEYAARGEEADIVYAAESFCEATDPDSHAAALSKLLAPGGLLYIHEPDGNHFRLPRNIARWNFADPPLNFSYLSKKGMGLLLGRHGLKIRKSFFTWHPFMRLVVERK